MRITYGIELPQGVALGWYASRLRRVQPACPTGVRNPRVQPVCATAGQPTRALQGNPPSRRRRGAYQPRAAPWEKIPITTVAPCKGPCKGARAVSTMRTMEGVLSEILDTRIPGHRPIGLSPGLCSVGPLGRSRFTPPVCSTAPLRFLPLNSPRIPLDGPSATCCPTESCLENPSP